MRSFLLGVLVAALLVGCDGGQAPSPQALPASQNSQVAPVGVDEMSIGHKLLIVDNGSPVPASDPRIQPVNSLIVAVADRFSTDEELVADMALVAIKKIREEGHEERIEDVLDAPLTATMGDELPLPALSTVLAFYVSSRISGSPPATAKRVAYAFVHVNAP